MLRGLSALGSLRLPLDEVLTLLTSKLLWEAFYKRLYDWYETLHMPALVTSSDVQAAILQVYPDLDENEFVAQATANFRFEVVQAVGFSAMLSHYGWTGPHLRLHQADAARRMCAVLSGESKDSFLLNADDPGMGKSASFLAAVAVSGIKSVIIIAPKTVADDTWWTAKGEGEIHRCLPHATIKRGISSTLSLPDFPTLTFCVLHYEELFDQERLEALAKRQIDCVCIDEMHLVKQRGGQSSSRRREALDVLRGAANAAIGLTGTPLVNELSEPMSLLQLLSANDARFETAPLRSERMSDKADVFEAIMPHIIRRRKRDVLLHLPAYDVHLVDIALADDLAEKILAVSCWPTTRTSEAMGALRKLSLQAKLPFLLLRAEGVHKLLVLTYLTDDVSEAIYESMEEFFPGQVAHVNGQVSKENREDILNSFRDTDGRRILIGTMGTIGMGVTLINPKHQQTAHEVIIADLPYTAAELDQGIARLHREGQRQRVIVDVLQTTISAQLRDGSPLQTIDQRIWSLIESKRDLSDIAIDGQYTTSDTAGKVRRALRLWLKQVREVGVEPLAVTQRPTEPTTAQRWRGEIARLRGMSTEMADERFASAEYTKAFLHHLQASSASRLAHQWLRGRLTRLLRPDLAIVDMGCGLNPFADLPCRVIGLDRHGLPGQVKGKMEAPPLPDTSADVLIYSLSLYGTSDNLRAYFTQAKRILRGGGHLFIVEPGASFTDEGLARFVCDLLQFGFEQVGGVKDVRGEDGVLLKGMHFTLTGEVVRQEETRFERK